MNNYGGKIQTREDGQRGCGWRKPGGLYLVATGLAAPCGRLPIPLDVCPCCGQGVKPARGWSWIDFDKFANVNPCPPPCNPACPLATRIDMAGLIWVGEAFYPSPCDFAEESDRLGVSRRIARVPRGFILGHTWVALAHRKGIVRPEYGAEDPRRHVPAIFQLFKPKAVEYICTGQETEEEVDALIKRGITPVEVKRKGQMDLPVEAVQGGV